MTKIFNILLILIVCLSVSCTQTVYPVSNDIDDEELIFEQDSTEIDSIAYSSISTESSSSSLVNKDSVSSSSKQESSSSKQESSSSIISSSSSSVEDLEGESTIGQSSMDKLTGEDAEELQAIKDSIDNGVDIEWVDVIENTDITASDMDFEANNYYCFAGENSWFFINPNKIKDSGLPFLWNNHAWGLLKKFLLRFECDLIFVIRK